MLVSGSATIFGAIYFSQPAAYDREYEGSAKGLKWLPTPAALHVGIFFWGGKGYEGLNWGRYREGRLSIYMYIISTSTIIYTYKAQRCLSMLMNLQLHTLFVAFWLVESCFWDLIRPFFSRQFDTETEQYPDKAGGDLLLDSLIHRIPHVFKFLHLNSSILYFWISLVEVVSTHLWNTHLNLSQQAIKGFLS